MLVVIVSCRRISVHASDQRPPNTKIKPVIEAIVAIWRVSENQNLQSPAKSSISSAQQNPSSDFSSRHFLWPS
jgi:hypothetical protein